MEHAANNRCLLGVEGLDAHTPHCETRVLIVAATGSDSANAAEVLTSERIPSVICESISEMCKVAREGAGAILITQEGLTHSGLSILAGLLQDQGPWSDMPLILISGGTDATVPGLTSLRSLSYS